MDKQEQIQKLILAQQKDKGYFVSPEKIPTRKLTTLLDEAGLTENEKICFVLKKCADLSNRRIAFYLKISHTYINKLIKSAKEKLQNRIVGQEEKGKEGYSEREEIEEIFNGFSLGEKHYEY